MDDQWKSFCFPLDLEQHLLFWVVMCWLRWFFSLVSKISAQTRCTCSKTQTEWREQSSEITGTTAQFIQIAVYCCKMNDHLFILTLIKWKEFNRMAEPLYYSSAVNKEIKKIKQSAVWAVRCVSFFSCFLWAVSILWVELKKTSPLFWNSHGTILLLVNWHKCNLNVFNRPVISWQVSHQCPQNQFHIVSWYWGQICVVLKISGIFFI